MELGQPCIQVRDLGMARAQDRDIFSAARDQALVFITKDSDFVELVARLGPPPGIILLTCGNTSTSNIRGLLKGQLATALQLIADGEPLVEIGGE